MGTVMKKNRPLTLFAVTLLAAMLVAVSGCWLFEPDIPASTITRIYVECSDRIDDTVSQELVIHEDGTATLTIESVSEDGTASTDVYGIDAAQLADLFKLIDSEDLVDNAMKPVESDEDFDVAYLPILVECGDKAYVPDTVMETNYPDRVDLMNMLILLDELREGSDSPVVNPNNQ